MNYNWISIILMTVYNSAYVSDKMIGTLIVGKCIARDVIFMSSLWGVVLSFSRLHSNGVAFLVHLTKRQAKLLPASTNMIVMAKNRR